MDECRLIRDPTDTLARAVLARTDPNEQESVVVLDGPPA